MKRQVIIPLLCGSILLAGCSTSGVIKAPSVSQTARADINCDGHPDDIQLSYPEGEAQVVVETILGDGQGRSKLRFGLGDGSRQNALCGDRAGLSVVASDSAALEEVLGNVPRGYQAGPGCSDLVLSGGECDSINLYWDHSRTHLNWWRN